MDLGYKFIKTIFEIFRFFSFKLKPFFCNRNKPLNIIGYRHFTHLHSLTHTNFHTYTNTYFLFFSLFFSLSLFLCLSLFLLLLIYVSIHTPTQNNTQTHILTVINLKDFLVGKEFFFLFSKKFKPSDVNVR